MFGLFWAALTPVVVDFYVVFGYADVGDRGFLTCSWLR